MTAEPHRAEEARARAEARFKLNEQRKTDAEKAMAEVEAHRAAELEKTVRLRALRLAKEEADRQEVPVPRKPTRAKKRA